MSTAVLREKRLLVNAHFDTIHAYFKTIPQCLLQIYMALDMNLPLKFCGITDGNRQEGYSHLITNLVFYVIQYLDFARWRLESESLPLRVLPTRISCQDI